MEEVSVVDLAQVLWAMGGGGRGREQCRDAYPPLYSDSLAVKSFCEGLRPVEPDLTLPTGLFDRETLTFLTSLASAGPHGSYTSDLFAQRTGSRHESGTA
jgi:hypothetical protein